MKKKEEIKFMDPNEARVYQWKEGKSRNLRALLCSLDTIIWQDSRWTVCGMHQVKIQIRDKEFVKK
jgi:cyclin G-associated kinase